MTSDDIKMSPLFSAIYLGDNEANIRALIDAGADVNTTRIDGETALFYAVLQSNNESVVRVLIDAGADVNATRIDGATALFHAVQQSNNESVVRALIDAGADVNTTNSIGSTALFIAVQQSNNESVVRALIDAGADVNTTNSIGSTALFHAVRQSNNESVVRALIDAGAHVNTTNKYGETALFHAVLQSNNESVVRALIDAGADVNQIDNQCETALFHAVRQSNNGSIVRALIDAGADVNTTNDYGKTSLFYAVNSKTSNTENVVRILIDAGANINAKDIFGRTPLFYALHDPVVARILLDKGGNKYLHLKDKYNCSILRCSVERGILRGNDFESILNELSSDSFGVHIQLGVRTADLFETIMNIVLSDFPLMLTNDHGKRLKGYSITVEYIRKLLQLAREYMDEEDSHQKIETLMAILENKMENPEKISEALRVLVELGADPNSGDSYGNTALHYATRLPLKGVGQEMVMEICRQLEKLDVQFNLRNHQNQTPLLFCWSGVETLKQEVQLSAIKTLVNVSEFLLKHGSSFDERSRSGETVFHLILKLLHQGLEIHDRKERQNVLQEMMKLLQLFQPEKISRVRIINIPDANLNTPLHLWASLALPSPQYYGNHVTKDQTFEEFLQTIFKYLLKCGAKLNSRNTDDQTPLHLCKTWSAVKLLLDAEAKPNDADSSGRSPLLLAAKRIQKIKNPASFYPDIPESQAEDPKTFWEIAIEIGLDPWTADKEGESVLSILIEYESYLLAKALVDVACERNLTTQSEAFAVSLLNVICKDKSSRLNWKTNLVESILKSRKRFTPKLLSQPLSFCCQIVLETDVFGDKAKEKYKSESVVVATNEDRRGAFDKQSPSKGRQMDISKEQSKQAELKKPSVHCEIIKMLCLYGARGTSCLDMADTCPGLKDLLKTPIDEDKVSALIPWTSVSKKHEDKLAKVARRQEYDVGHEVFWYHKDHIGSGSFGYIFVGINEKDGREVAIKRIEKLRMKRPEDKREITNLIALADCEQVVRYLDFFEDEKFAYIVLGLMEGNLDEYLTDGSAYDGGKCVQLCEDIVKGLKYLHEKDIIHRDLKPGNILYKTHSKLCLKIADFGLSRCIDSTATTVYGTNAGTRCWIAPEVLMGTHDHSPASDMFSCGLVLHYILSKKKHPFSKNNSQVAHQIETNITSGKTEGWDNSLSPEATHLVKAMLGREDNRPTAGQALDHPVFWSRTKKMDLLIAVGNQSVFEYPRKGKRTCLTAVEADLENNFSTIVVHGEWNDPKYNHMPAIYTEMEKKRSYDTQSVVELVRLIRNAHAHVSEVTRPTAIRKLILEDFVFLEYFPSLVMEVYKVVITHEWHQTKEEIKYAMNR